MPAVTTHEVCSSDGTRIQFYCLGGDGPDLLICHATGFHAMAYAPLGLELLQHFRVWALDFRGHGRSDESATGEYAWKLMNEDLLACAGHIGASPMFGFGHSMGGAALVGAQAAQPEIFKALYLYEPVILPTEFYQAGDPSPLVNSALKRRQVFSSRSEALQRYASRLPLSTLHADALAAYVEHGFVDTPDGQVRLACRAEVEAATFEASDYISLEAVPPLEVPVVVAAGGLASIPNPGQFAVGISEQLPQARFHRFDDLGHLGPLESPVGVAQHVAATLLA